MADGRYEEYSGHAAASLAIGSLLLLGAFLLLLGSIALFGRASDGEPSAALDIALYSAHRMPAVGAPGGVRPVTHRRATRTRPAASWEPSGGAGSQGAAPAPVTPPNPPSATPAKFDKPLYAGRNLIADPALIETTAEGPLPRIAEDGRMPMTAYAPPSPPASEPRIALVINGLGISAIETEEAIEKLPPQVTLAFAPYTDDVEQWVAEARARGHEVLLELPMEPYDFPDSDPGPHTLRAAVSEQSNTERLTWALTRFTGYAGVTNLLGGRFLADPDSVAPVMTFLARRGLLFFDSGPEDGSAAPDVARQISAPYVRSALAVDGIQTATEIDARLSELESKARAGGAIAGTGFVYPVTIERVTNWAGGLAGRGFVLVPPSAIVTHTK